MDINCPLDHRLKKISIDAEMSLLGIFNLSKKLAGTVNEISTAAKSLLQFLLNRSVPSLQHSTADII